MYDGALSQTNISLVGSAGTTLYSDTRATMSHGDSVDNIFHTFQITKAVVGVGASLKVTLQTSKDGTTWKDLIISSVEGVAVLVPGKKLINQRIPQGLEKHLRVKIDIIGGAITSGEAFSGFSNIA